MIKFWLGGLCFQLMSLESDLTVFTIAERSGKGSAGIAPETIDNVGRLIAIMTTDLEKMGGFLDTVLLAHRLIPRLTKDGAQQWTVSRMIEALENFKHQLSVDMGNHRWARIDGKYEIYFVNPHPWGKEIYDTFPETRQDVVDAGLAMGAELYTASVFHSMRVAESGLKWLAKRLKVKLIANKKPLPTDEATWQVIINGLNSQILRARQMIAGAKKRTRLEQYANAAQHCDYMKDIWRNNVSHAHKTYNQSEAEAAMQRVRDFMRLLTVM